jgi:ribosomal protein L7/L12
MTFPVGQLPPDVLKALESGRTIDAIKRLRKATGLGLAEAKAVIDAHRRSQPPPVPSLGGAAGNNAPDGGRVLPEAVLEALQRGDKNEAARLLRERLGLSVNAAKKRIESAGAPGSVFETGHPNVPHLDHRIDAPQPHLVQNRPDFAPGEVAHSNGAFWLVVALVFVLIVYLAAF